MDHLLYMVIHSMYQDELEENNIKNNKLIMREINDN